MKQSLFLFLLFLLLFNNLVNSQELSPEKQEISNSISEYFSLDRENIHLHLDKNIFLSNEEIWFKGYVFDRKNNNPFIKTTNVYASILNKDGIKITQKLLYCNNGIFSGSFKLNKTFESGDYYIQIYTNWMNNFIEDESFVSKILIINESESTFVDSKKINLYKINVEFNPEGNSFIEGISNNIGVKISDCNGNPIMVNDIEIINSKNENIRLFKTNQFGFGKFNLKPTSENYKIVFVVNNKKVEAQLPKVSQIGIALEVNNNALDNKTILKLKTNESSINLYKEKILTVIIQQDDKVYFFDVDFKNNKLDQELIFSNDYLYDGINTIRILDNGNKVLCERIIYNFQENNSKAEFFVQSKIGNKISLAGNTNLNVSNLSISILPENSISCNDLTDIYASLLLNPYLNDKVINGKYYFNETNRIKKNELDLMLLNQKSKYIWSNLLNNPPKSTYLFEQGINIKGTINQVVSKPKNFKIKAYSISSQILKLSEINKKDEFYFENLIVPDSSKVNFTLVTNPDFKTVPLKYYAQIDKKTKNFNKTYYPRYSNCIDSTKFEDNSKIDIPRLRKNEILLSEVEIKAKKNKLQYENTLGNSSLRGYKIGDLYGNMNVLDFISIRGFQVTKKYGEVSIDLRARSSNFITLNKKGENINSPLNRTQVFINDFNITTLNELSEIQLTEVDEIYTGTGAAYRFGIIKIYLKKPKPRKMYTNSFLVSGGFEMIKDFRNLDYASTFDKGFENFGVISFNKEINPNENGYFNFDIPNFNQKEIKILIEGFNNEGKLISEIKSLNIE